ncbi:hypothetical protein A0H76_2323 [Hepatospora eriocheir]|uniref:Uncharacterized protein n=1 Tax=Hepatospora eriocheir TaxID=1081669 RepID=A0A1X0QFF6_9MICR|nr:hypothetical protein A0H76_2323 [Hepatospora eriocheir]
MSKKKKTVIKNLENGAVEADIKNKEKTISNLQSKISCYKRELTNLKVKIIKLNTKITELNTKLQNVNKIKMNEELYENLKKLTEKQEIIIDSLTNQIINMKKASEINVNKFNETDKSNEIDKEEKSSDNNENVKKIKKTTEKDLIETKFDEIGVKNLTKDILNIFNQKITIKEFNENFTIKEFTEYAKSDSNFNLTDKIMTRSKKPIRMYVMDNLDSIIRFIFTNINKYDLNRLCSTLYFINTEISPKRKLVIALDILMIVKQPSCILYLISALFNNDLVYNETDNELSKLSSRDLILKVLNSLFYHLLNLDMNLYENSNILKNLNRIKNNLSIKQPNENLYELLDKLLKLNYVNIIDFENRRFNNEVNTAVSLVRTICRFLDWDYTYNTVILEKLDIKNNPYHTYTLASLSVSAYSELGLVKSVKNIFNEFVFIMDKPCEVSYICYVILKTIRSDKTGEFLEFHKDNID